MNQCKKWNLKKDGGRRFQSGHPWVFSSELQNSPSGIQPGDFVELLDSGGKFLARGYGNPNSLIAFRACSRDLDEKDIFSKKFFKQRLLRAQNLRIQLGLHPEYSYRWVFAESDDLPGIVIDRYSIQGTPSVVVVVQLNTAGADRAEKELVEALEEILKTEQHPQYSIVVCRDGGLRTLEGLPIENERKVIGVRISQNIPIRIAPVGFESQKRPPILFDVDFLAGQKTGFFLDQGDNVRAVAHLLQRRMNQGQIRILDLFCYVGQWSAGLASQLPGAIEITLVDASAEALRSAELNCKRELLKRKDPVSIVSIKADIMKWISPNENQKNVEKYDCVVVDPPAFVKRKKDIGPGKQAYLKLFRHAFRKLKPGGCIVVSSCSHWLSEIDLEEVLIKAESQARLAGDWKKTDSINWIWRGGHAADHPIQMAFPEGRYLKCWAGVLSD